MAFTEWTMRELSGDCSGECGVPSVQRLPTHGMQSGHLARSTRTFGPVPLDGLVGVRRRLDMVRSHGEWNRRQLSTNGRTRSSAPQSKRLGTAGTEQGKSYGPVYASMVKTFLPTVATRIEMTMAFERTASVRGTVW